MRIAASLLTAGVVLALAWFAPPAAAQSADPVGEAVGIEGTVHVHRAAGSDALQPGTQLFALDRVVTAADGRALLAMNDGSEITVGPDTEVALAQYAGDVDDTAGAVWKLVKGILRAALPGSGAAPLDVETGVAVASARSTVFIVEAGVGATAVLAVEDRVAVSAKDGSVGAILAPGFGLDVLADEPAKGPRQWPEARVESFLERTTLR